MTDIPMDGVLTDLTHEAYGQRPEVDSVKRSTGP